MDLIHTEFLNYYKRYCSKAEYFTQSLLVLDYYTRNPRVVPMSYHISDWILFGLTKDINKFYSNVSLQSEKDGLYYLKQHNHSPIFKHVLARLAPEQHIICSFLKQYKDIQITEYFDSSSESIFETENLLVDNFIIMNLKNSGIRFLKYSPNQFFEYSTLINQADWQCLCLIKKNNVWAKILYYIRCKIRKFNFFYLRASIVKLIRILHLKNSVKKLIRRMK